MNLATHRPRSTAQGFTLVEVSITAVVLAIVIIGVGATGSIASRTMATTDRRADAVERVLHFFQRVDELSRAGVLSTYAVQAGAADVAAGRAARVGDWIDPVDGQARNSVRFAAADGNLAMSASSVTQPIELHFRRDEAEDPATNPSAQPDRDDDGDGLVDEGRIDLRYEDTEVTIVTGVDRCDMTLVGHGLTIEVRTARRGSAPQVELTRVFTLRNN